MLAHDGGKRNCCKEWWCWWCDDFLICVIFDTWIYLLQRERRKLFLQGFISFSYKVKDCTKIYYCKQKVIVSRLPWVITVELGKCNFRGRISDATNWLEIDNNWLFDWESSSYIKKELHGFLVVIYLSIIFVFVSQPGVVHYNINRHTHT
jgi:hypothetical protein